MISRAENTSIIYNMIHFFIGTKAQLIKTAPVMLELQKMNVPFRYIDSGQHAEFTSEIRRDLQLPEPDVFLGRSSDDVASYGSASKWLGQTVLRWAFRPSWIRERVFGGHGGICVVHGDTASTLIGARYAWRAGLEVAHLEAGLRSYNYFNPFPEEWIRVHCMKRAALLFAPDRPAVENLERVKVLGEIVQTKGNTVIDSLRLVVDRQTGSSREPYLLATFHRLETLNSRKRMKAAVNLLNEATKYHPVKFVTHKPTEKALGKYQLRDKLGPLVEQLPMQPYHRFIDLMQNAETVLADGGSIQEECAILGKPLIILRDTTERPDGIGVSAALCPLDDVAKLHELLSTTRGQISKYEQPKDKQPHSPSKAVANRLKHYCGESDA